MFSSFNTSLLILLLFGISTMSGLEFEEQENQSGFIFVNLATARVSYDSFTLVYHIDLSNYKQLVPVFAKTVTGMFLYYFIVIQS